MTPAQATIDEIEEVSQEDFENAVTTALARLGLTLDSLRDQARQDDFVSEEARMAWFVIAPLVDAA